MGSSRCLTESTVEVIYYLSDTLPLFLFLTTSEGAVFHDVHHQQLHINIE